MEIDVAEIPLRAGFTSRELDAETGLYYFGARYYNSWSGRWYSVDPLASKYPGWSPYNYVEDNPTGSVDPNGMQWYRNRGGTITYNANVNSQNYLNQHHIAGTFLGSTWWTASKQGNVTFYNSNGSKTAGEFSAPGVTVTAIGTPSLSSSMSMVQSQANSEALAETKAFYGSIFQGTAYGADMVSEASNYAILFAVPLGPEAVGSAAGVGDAADWVSLGAKTVGSGLINGHWTPVGEQLLKASINTATLRAFAAAEADAQLAKDPFLKAEISTAINAIYR